MDAAALPYKVELIEKLQVCPPHGSVSSRSLPLTFYDSLWLVVPVLPKRIFFYEIPMISTSKFMNDALPNLRQSLSLALQHFFPFVGNLACPASQPTSDNKPHILYREGDSLTLKVLEAKGADFNQLIQNCRRDVRDFHPLVPDLPPDSTMSANGDVEELLFPLMALQVTIFPGYGICIGITYRHVVADGRSFHHFIKTWASTSRSMSDNGSKLSSSSVGNSLLPSYYDREKVQDPLKLQDFYVSKWWESREQQRSKPNNTELEQASNGKVRATFVMRPRVVERLKKGFNNRMMSSDDKGLPNLVVSSFTAICSFLWVSIIKSQGDQISQPDGKEAELCHFIFLADCRDRYRSGIASGYFGNCVAPTIVSAKRSELKGESGELIAAKLIGGGVKDLQEAGIENAFLRRNSRAKELSNGHVVSVAGSPKLGIYETDFGWGKPKKSEVVHIDADGAISLAECKDEDGGVELSLALTTSQMQAFTSIFEDRINNLS